MPEFVEVEAYANTIRPLIGGTITGIDLRDERFRSLIADEVLFHQDSSNRHPARATESVA